MLDCLRAKDLEGLRRLLSQRLSRQRNLEKDRQTPP